MSSAPYLTHLSADTIYGICRVHPEDYPEADWIEFLDFKNSIDHLEDGESIFCAVDPDQLEELREDYTISLY